MAASNSPPEVLHYTAFTDGDAGGNPAGVVLDASGLDAAQMLAIAADVGYSETAFLRPRPGCGERREFDVAYYTPEVEVPFCGHATIASAVALADRDGPGELWLHAPAGEVAVRTRSDGPGRHSATLESVEPEIAVPAAPDVDAVLAALGWDRAELDPRLPPRIAYAGSRHLVLAAATRERLGALRYDYEALRAVMVRLGLITVALIWREAELVLHARNPAPSLGIVEDPATGAAAAALGAYLVSVGAVGTPSRLVVLQGFDMGHPCRLVVELDPSRRGVLVSGAAARLDDMRG